jgi:hypothetical protein
MRSCGGCAFVRVRERATLGYDLLHSDQQQPVRLQEKSPPRTPTDGISRLSRFG